MQVAAPTRAWIQNRWIQRGGIRSVETLRWRQRRESAPFNRRSSPDPVAQLHDPIAQLLLRLEWCVDLVALAVPSCHGEVELRVLQPTHLEIPARPRPDQRMPP